MKKFVIQVFLLVVLIFGLLFFGALGPNQGHIPFVTPKQPPAAPRQNVVIINGTQVKVDIADTQEKRQKGLGGTQPLATDSGMLFVFPKEDKYTFWMKGLTYPLDLIWIKKKTVVDIHKNAPPPAVGQKDEDLPRFTPAEPVDMVLEVAGGFADMNNVKIGDTIEIP